MGRIQFRYGICGLAIGGYIMKNKIKVKIHCLLMFHTIAEHYFKREIIGYSCDSCRYNEKAVEDKIMELRKK